MFLNHNPNAFSLLVFTSISFFIYFIPLFILLLFSFLYVVFFLSNITMLQLPQFIIIVKITESGLSFFLFYFILFLFSLDLFSIIFYF